MKKRINTPNRVFAKSIFVLAAAIFLVSIVSKGQDGISSKDSAGIMKYMNEISAKIDAELKKNKELYNEMEKALGQINAIKDTALLDAAIDAYTAKYKDAYGAALKNAGVDMNKCASDLHLKYPYILFAVNNFYSLEWEQESKSVVYEIKELSTETTTTTTLSSFTSDKEEQCLAVAGSSTKFDGRNIHSYAEAAVIGGCATHGSLVKKVDLPADAKKIILKLNYTLKRKGKAVSQFGLTGASSKGSVKTTIVDTKTLQYNYYAREIIAPLHWTAKYNKEKDYTNSIDLTQYKGKTLRIEGKAAAAAFAEYVSNSHADGYSKITKAELIITK